MQVEYTGRQVTVTPALRVIAEESMERIDKILGKTASAHVILTAEKYRQIAEVTVKTKLQSLVGTSESTSMEAALRDALSKTETQAIRHKKKFQAEKRQPKEEKLAVEPALSRPRRSSLGAPEPGNTIQPAPPVEANGKLNGKATSAPVVPVTVHSFPATSTLIEPHVVRSIDSVALRPMSLEEAVKEAEFRDREVFVFRDPEGNVKVLHRKSDGKMELIELP